MRGENKKKKTVNLTLNDGDKVGDGGQGVRGGRPLVKTSGGRAHSNK